MTKIQRYLIRLFSLAGIILTAAQIFMHTRGGELCFNESCTLVESYLNLDPFIVNLAGGMFFLSILCLSFFAQRDKALKSIMEFLMLCGFIAEGILLGIQMFLVHSFCSYCLTICSLIILTGLVYRPGIFIAGILFMSLELGLFSAIKLPYAGNVSLNSGTYAVKSCSNPVSVAYLIFSESCPHCKKVINALHGCVSCEIHFNPVSEINEELLPGLTPIEDYKPEINVMALKLFGINSVPVIIEQTKNGFDIIKGDAAILRYIRESCFCGSQKPAPADVNANQDLLLPGDSGVCSIYEECK